MTEKKKHKSTGGKKIESLSNRVAPMNFGGLANALRGTGIEHAPPAAAAPPPPPGDSDNHSSGVANLQIDKNFAYGSKTYGVPVPPEEYVTIGGNPDPLVDPVPDATTYTIMDTTSPVVLQNTPVASSLTSVHAATFNAHGPSFNAGATYGAVGGFTAPPAYGM